MSIVEVAVAIFIRQQTEGGEPEFLLAQRPPDKVYAGYWEFPGGKVEPGETTFEALVREIHEELGVHIELAAPWISLQYTYPHATVRLKFFHVHAWQGTIAPLEHTGLKWTTMGEPPEVTPVLPANGPILRALTLPHTGLMVEAKTHGTEEALANVAQALDEGIKLVLVDGSMPDAAEQEKFANELARLSRRHEGAWVMPVDDTMLAQCIHADGLCLSAKALSLYSQRPPFDWTAAICHQAQDLAKAADLGLDFAILDVCPLSSQPDGRTDWQRFSTLVENSPIPVFALCDSPITPENLLVARSHGAHGLLQRSQTIPTTGINQQRHP